MCLGVGGREADKAPQDAGCFGRVAVGECDTERQREAWILRFEAESGSQLFHGIGGFIAVLEQQAEVMVCFREIGRVLSDFGQEP